MSPRTRKQFDAIRHTRRLQIMETALKLFALEGYGNCTISRLASQAAISKGLMYNYFDSKEALLESVIEQGLNDIMELIDPDHDGVLTSDELVGFIRKIFSSIRSRQEYWILFITVIMQPKVKTHLKDKPIIHYVEQFSSMMLEYFKKRGFEDPYLELVNFSAMIEGFGVLLMYAYPIFEFPEEMMLKFENRIIDMYT